MEHRDGWGMRVRAHEDGTAAMQPADHCVLDVRLKAVGTLGVERLVVDRHSRSLRKGRDNDPCRLTSRLVPFICGVTPNTEIGASVRNQLVNNAHRGKLAAANGDGELLVTADRFAAAADV